MGKAKQMFIKDGYILLCNSSLIILKFFGSEFILSEQILLKEVKNDFYEISLQKVAYSALRPKESKQIDNAKQNL